MGQEHTPSIAFRHLPPNSARTGYTTEGAPFISAQLSSDAVSALATEEAPFISAQLSSDAVSALRKVWVLIKLQALVYDILPSGEGAGKRCSECGY